MRIRHEVMRDHASVGLTYASPAHREWRADL